MLHLNRTFIIVLPVLLVTTVPAAYAQSAPAKVKVADVEYSVTPISNGRMLRIDDIDGHMIGMAGVNGATVSVLAPQQEPGFSVVRGAATAYLHPTSGAANAGASALPPPPPPEGVAGDDARAGLRAQQLARLQSIAGAAGNLTNGAAGGPGTDKIVVKDFTAAGVIVYDPSLKADVTISNDGTKVTAMREIPSVTGKSKVTMVGYFEGGDKPSSGLEKLGKIAKGAGTTLASIDNARTTSGTRTDSETWELASVDAKGKMKKEFELGDFRLGQTTAAIGRDPGKVMGEGYLRSFKADLAAVTDEAAKRKAAGQDVPFDMSGERSQRALAALNKYIPD